MSTAYAEPLRPEAASPPRSRLRWLLRVRRLAPLLASVVVTIAAAPAALLLAERFDDLASSTALGYPALFLVQLVTSATLFLPAPGAAFALAAGAVWNPIWVGIFAGLGSATGELTGYGLGYFGRRAAPVETSCWWRVAERGFRRWGFVALVVMALIPNPVVDALGILAGCLRYPVLRYWAATAIGKTFKFGLLAYLADVALAWMGLAA